MTLCTPGSDNIDAKKRELIERMRLTLPCFSVESLSELADLFEDAVSRMDGTPLSIGLCARAVVCADRYLDVPDGESALEALIQHAISDLEASSEHGGRNVKSRK